MSDDTFSGITWDMCISNYESLREYSQETEKERQLEGFSPSEKTWEPFIDGMLNLITNIRADKEFPEVIKNMTHASLRLALPLKESEHSIEVYIHWQLPNHYLLQLGGFGHEKIIVPADNIILAIKQYLKLTQKRSQPRSPNQPTQIREVMFSKEYFLSKYSKIPPEWVHTNVISLIRDRTSQAQALLKAYFNGDYPNVDLYDIYRTIEEINSIIDAAKEFYANDPEQNFFSQFNDD